MVFMRNTEESSIKPTSATVNTASLMIDEKRAGRIHREIKEKVFTELESVPVFR